MSILKLLETSFNDPLLLTFLSIWIVGWFIKNRTKINNKIIPIIITLLGLLLGMFIIEFSVRGAITGIVIAGIQMGGYDLIRSLKKFMELIFNPLIKDLSSTNDVSQEQEEFDADELPHDDPN